MRSGLKGLLLLCLCSWIIAQENNQEFRATWVITWEHNCDSVKIKSILDNHQKANMNAVLFQVRQGGTAYYPSSYEPWGYYVNYTDPGFDPLAFVVEEAHKRGIEVHAWFNTFQTSSTHAGAPAAEHPEWVCRDRDGNAMTEHRAVSPGLAAVRDYTRDVAMEIVNNYDIDGIHLDYVRWNEYSSSKKARKIASGLDEHRMLDGMIPPELLEELKQSKSGRYLYDVDHPYSSGVPTGFGSWEAWWRESVTEFVQSLHDSIQAVKPWIRLSVAALGRYRWGGWQGYETVYQDAGLWFNEGYIEQLTPMHYHWTTGSGFVYMLDSGGSDSWVYWIQPGIDAGRLFSAGPGSYILQENNIWKRHPEIVNDCRTVDWLDGFQFFSYGSWKGYQYFEEAGNTFFENKTKIRNVYSGTPPASPSIAINKLDSLHYELTITPDATQNTAGWFAVYRSTDAVIDTATDQIIDLHFGNTAYTIADSFPGTQDYDDIYYYGSTSLNRYWNESVTSNIIQGDPIPSFAPTVVWSLPGDNDSVDYNTDVKIGFSKNIDTSTVRGNIVFDPVVEIDGYIWEDGFKTLHLDMGTVFEFDSTYSLTLSADIRDVNGKQLDGNGDGIPGDAYRVTFHTYEVDLSGPMVEFSYPNNDITNYDLDNVWTVLFDELVDPETVNENTVQLINNGKQLSVEPLLTTYNNQSLLNVKSYAQLLANSSAELIISDAVSDTNGNQLDQPLNFTFQTKDYYYHTVEILDDFSGAGNWQDPGFSGSTTGILESGSSFNYNRGNYRPASAFNDDKKKSARLRYEWDPEASNHFLREHCKDGAPTEVQIDTSYILQCYVYGDGSQNQLRFSLYQHDSDGSIPSDDIAEVSQWITLDWVGWRLVEWDLGDTSSVGSWIGDGLMDGAYYEVESIQLTWAEDGAVSGELYFDNLRLVKKTQGQQPENHPPVLDELADTTMTAGGYIAIRPTWSDPDENDTHQILVYADTSVIEYKVMGSTSGSQVYLVPDENFTGEVGITLIVRDFGIGELADTTHFTLTVNPASGIVERHLPEKFRLRQNYPNPFNPITTIQFSVPRQSIIQIRIYDLLGRVVSEPVNQTYQPGNYRVQFDGSQMASGYYIYQLIAEQKVITRKMLLLK